MPYPGLQFLFRITVVLLIYGPTHVRLARNVNAEVKTLRKCLIFVLQALRKGLKRCLNLCAQQHLCSVAFPVIGPGRVLKYPLSEAIQVLTETLHQFGLSAVSDCLSTIHIVIKPGYPDSEEVTFNTTGM